MTQTLATFTPLLKSLLIGQAVYQSPEAAAPSLQLSHPYPPSQCLCGTYHYLILLTDHPTVLR